MQVITNGAHHDFPSVEADAQAQLQPPRAAHFLGVGAHSGLHGQGGIAGAQGMVFMRNWGAEQGHNAIAQHLVHRALEAVHRLHHDVNGRVEELLGGFGVKAPDEFRRVLEVGKQHRHLLALACQGGTGSQDLVGQVGWGVGQWSCVWLMPLTQCGCGGWRGCGSRRTSRVSSPRPDQATAFVRHQLRVGEEQGVLDIFEGRIIQVKLTLYGPIGHPTPTLE
jgi:hypothetical protein